MTKFEKWLKRVHDMTMEDFFLLNEFQQKALEIEFKGY